MKKIPMRKCLGCMESKPKNELCRIVRTPEGEILLDKTGKKNGRGAYICKEIQCLEIAKKSKRIEKELGTNISEEKYLEIQNMMEME